MSWNENFSHAFNKFRDSKFWRTMRYCYYHNYFVFLLNYMIIAAYYLLLLFYEITKLQRYWLVNLGAFVKWTHRAQIFLLQLDIFNDFSASSSISTLNLVSCSSKIIIFIYSLIHAFITIIQTILWMLFIYIIKRLNI